MQQLKFKITFFTALCSQEIVQLDQNLRIKEKKFQTKVT